MSSGPLNVDAGAGAPIPWVNWASNQRALPVEVAHPRSAGEVAEVVGEAAGRGQRVKVTGSGHSFTGIGRPEGVRVVLDHMAGLVSADIPSGLVTVQAGMSLARLNRLLAEMGLAMSNLGDVDAQTLAGAIATGTHGTGERHGGLATQVRALELVLADGSVISCSAEESPELFSAARVGLGALGIVTAVTLQTEPLFPMRAVEGPMSLDELLGRFDELARGVDHFEAYWFPHTRTCLTKANSRLAPGTPLDRLTRWREWAEDELLSNTVFGLAQRVGRISPRAIPSLSRISARALGPRSFTDLSHRVFTSPRRVRFKEMEYALPREATVPVLGELVDSLSRSELRISFPIEIRVAPADDILLSTASGRDSAYVAVHVDHASPHQPYFSLVESIMTAVGGRPHWGKLHTLRAGDLRPRYPAFDRFVALRDRLDPEGRFTNTYLDRVLGPPPGSG